MPARASEGEDDEPELSHGKHALASGAAPVREIVVGLVSVGW
jgi:hypothetical protein